MGVCVCVFVLLCVCVSPSLSLCLCLSACLPLYLSPSVCVCVCTCESVCGRASVPRSVILDKIVVVVVESDEFTTCELTSSSGRLLAF